jgi:DEAD/DEAH box helicase domain-containing protein
VRILETAASSQLAGTVSSVRAQHAASLLAKSPRAEKSARLSEVTEGSGPAGEDLDLTAAINPSAHSHSHGDVLVRSQVVGFKKIKFFTNENVGAGTLELPENEMHTTSYWITLERPLLESLPFSVSERQSGMFGLLHALESVATLLLMCDRRDLGTAIGERPPAPGEEGTDRNVCPTEVIGDFTPTRFEDTSSANAKEFFEPNLYLFDAYPGGIGFSEPLFRTHNLLLQKARELIAACPCDNGCPSCVGPAGDLAPRAKEAALAILDRLCA